MFATMFATKSKFAGLLTAAALAVALSACQTTEAAKPAEVKPIATPVSEASSTTITTNVMAIDRRGRLLTVRLPEGRLVTVRVGEDAPAFDKLRTGDKINLTYTESLVVNIMPKGSMKEGVTVDDTAGRVAPGVLAAGRQVKVVVKITNIDTVNNTVSFHGANGVNHTVAVKDPARQAKLGSLKKGQMIELTYTEALATSIEYVAPVKKTSTSTKKKAVN